MTKKISLRDLGHDLAQEDAVTQQQEDEWYWIVDNEDGT